MAESEFFKEAVAAGFSEKQARWMEENLAEEGHTHEIGDVEGLAEALDADEADDTEDEEPE